MFIVSSSNRPEPVEVQKRYGGREVHNRTRMKQSVAKEAFSPLARQFEEVCHSEELETKHMTEAFLQVDVLD